MKWFKPTKKQHAEMNITSLIDIIFILLVFFMVSSTFLKPVIRIKLPVAATVQKEKREKINVFVSEFLDVYVDKKEMTIPEMQERIAKEAAETPELAVMLFCDNALIFKHVVTVLDALKLAGVKNVAISHTAKK